MGTSTNGSGNGAVAEQLAGDLVEEVRSAADGPAPLIGCDQPIDGLGAIVHNELLLTGWAVAASPVSGVVVQIDDRVYNATYGIDSPWVAENIDYPGSEHAGYQLKLDTSSWKPGPRKITIAVFDADGGRADVSGQVEVLPFAPPCYSADENRAAIADGRVAMWVETPAIAFPGGEAEAPLEVTGWAHAAGGIEAVIVTVDNRVRENALRPLVRPDLVDLYGADVAAGGGFALRLHESECGPGPHTITVVAIGLNGEAVGVSGTILCKPATVAPAEPPGQLVAADLVSVDWLTNERRQRPQQHPTPERYDPDEHGGSMIEAEHQLRYRWVAELVDGKEVLDAGCGVGWGTKLLAEAGAKRVVGLDISKDALAEARRRTSKLEAVELTRGDLRALAFDDASFDVIVCYEAIEHVADPEIVIEELRRVLRPNGVLAISTPRRRHGHWDNEHHMHEFTPGEFERALRDRFKRVRVHRQQSYLASAVVDDRALGIADGETDLKMGVRKLEENRPGGEAYTVILAGDKRVPKLGRMAMVASPHAIFRLHETALRWEDRALLAEADAAASRVECQVARMQQEATVRRLSHVERQAASAEERAADLQRSERALAELRSRLEHSESEARELGAERERQTQAIGELEGQRERDEQAIEQHSEHADRLSGELAIAHERVHAFEERLARQERSLSWRMTRPLRWVKRQVLLMRPAPRHDSR